MVGVLVRVVADAADRGGQQAHFRGGAHVLGHKRAAPSGPARGAAWPVELLAPVRPPASQSGTSRDSRGLTDLGELAKSCRPWAVDFETSLSPGGAAVTPDATCVSAVSPGILP